MMCSKPPVKFELWTSNQNRAELHFFVDGEYNSYVFGCNPELFTEHEVAMILDKLGHTMPIGIEAAWE